MNCPICHRYAPDDPETGYNVDDVCPDCSAQGWTLDARGNVVNVNEEREREQYVAALTDPRRS